MKVIYKYELAITDVQVIEVPSSTHIIIRSIGEQNNKPCIWIELEVTKDNPTKIELYTIETGHYFNFKENNLQYVGTYQIDNSVVLDQHNYFVGHVYQKIE
jgi:hypothetical protein